MPASDFALLAPDLTFVHLLKGAVLAEAGVENDALYFLEGSIASVIARSSGGNRCEANLFGLDGAGPASLILGSTSSVLDIVVQVSGGCYRLPRAALADALDASATLRTLLLQYVQVMAVQSAFTSLSNANHEIDERLARWILMCHDRSLSDEIRLTHEGISTMLAVRRPSVTTSLHVLEGNRLIRNERGLLMIRNRQGLEDFAADAYGIPEAEYRRTIGPMSWSWSQKAGLPRAPLTRVAV